MKKKRRRRAIVCPEHGVLMVKTNTRYGPRFDCPESRCTMVQWGYRSHPANDQTRRARKKAHAAFDPLWKSGRFNRTELYRLLAVFMGQTVKETHMAFFSVEQCDRVQEFVKGIYRKDGNAGS